MVVINVNVIVCILLQGEKPEENPVCLNPMDEYFNDGYHSETTVSSYKYEQFNARGLRLKKGSVIYFFP